MKALGSKEQRLPLPGVVVQLVRIPACHAGGRGFESRPLRQYKKSLVDQRSMRLFHFRTGSIFGSKMLIPVYFRGSSYYLHTRVNGVQFKRSLQTSNKAIAMMRASRLMEALVKIDLSGIRTYEIDLKNGVLKSEG